MGELLTQFGEWLLDALLHVPKKLVEWLCEALATIFEAIPVPGFLQNGDGLFSSIAPEVWFFASIAQMHVGIPLVLTAYVARFTLRRLPVIG